MSTPLEYENAVGERYARAADAQEPALCCPVVYRQDLLEVIPQEIIDRDYGCGDPSFNGKPEATAFSWARRRLRLAVTRNWSKAFRKMRFDAALDFGHCKPWRSNSADFQTVENSS